MPSYKFYLKYIGTPDPDDFTNGSDHILYDQEWHQFYPGLNRDAKLMFTAENHKKRSTFDGELTFFDNEHQTDFTYLYQIESASVEIDLRVEQICETTSSDWWNGYFSIVDGKWDSDRGTLLIKPLPNDAYRELEAFGDKEFNILSANISHTEPAAITYSTIATEIITECTALNIAQYKAANPLPPGDDWNFYATCGDDPTGCETGQQFYTFKKQSFPVRIDSSYDWDEYKSMWSKAVCATQSGTISPAIPSRGMKLEEVIQFFLDELTDLTYKSTFFLNDDYPTGDGRTVDAGKNYVTNQSNKLLHLLLFQKSDTKQTTNRATKGIMTFNELMDMLHNMFNVYWFIDSDGNFRIEHEAYWDANPSSDTDLTTLDSGRWIKSKNKWEYDTKDMCNIEKFSMVEASSVDFIGYPIVYDNVETGNKYNDNVKEYRVNVTTEIGYIYSSPENIDNDGWVLLQTDGSGNIENEAGKIITLGIFPNGHLSWSALHENYWRHGRVVQNGTMNNVATTFTSWKRRIMQTDIVYPECCDSFDMDSTKTTELGDGEVRSAEYKLIDGSLKTNFFFS